MIRHLFFVFLILQPIHSYAQDISVLSEGYGASRNESLRDLKRSAVEQGLGLFLSSKTLTQDFVVERDKILTHAEGYVKNISIITEEHNFNSTEWHIQANVVVASDSIKSEMIALKMLLNDAEMPRIIVLMKEQINGVPINHVPTSETTMVYFLTEKHFHLIDSGQAQKVRNHDIAMAILHGDEGASKLIAAQFGADFVIAGEAKCESQQIFKSSTMMTNQAQVNIKILNASTGALIAAKFGSGKAAQISENIGCAQAIESAVNEILDNYLVDQLIAGMMNEQNNGMLIRLKVISGLTSYSAYKQIKQLLESIDNIVSVDKRVWNKKTGFAEFNIVFKGTTEMLADILEGIDGKNSESHHSLQVSDLTRNEIAIEY